MSRLAAGRRCLCAADNTNNTIFFKNTQTQLYSLVEIGAVDYRGKENPL